MSLILFTIHTQSPKAKTQNPSEATIAATAPTHEATSNTTIAATPFSKTEIATQPHRSAIATQPSEPARQHAAQQQHQHARSRDQQHQHASPAANSAPNPGDAAAAIEPSARTKPATNHHQDTNSTSNAVHEGERGTELPPRRVKEERERGEVMEVKEMNEILSKNRVEDVSWLCSLSESELDKLISLKLLVLQRAKVIGHQELADKFDLKTLRALGFILMEHLKEKVKDLSLFPGSAEPLAFVAGCNLLKCDNDNILTVEELKTCLHIDSKR